jgi:hypothetical protein
MGANVRPVYGPFAGQTTPTVLRLRQGVSGYAGAHDTYVRADTPTVANGSATSLTADGDIDADTALKPAHALVRFDDLAASVPAGASILSAKLVVKTTNDSLNTMQLYRMTRSWSESDTWNSLTNGVDVGTDTAGTPEFLFDEPQLDSAGIFDVTNSVQAWLNGSLTNFGWAVLPTGTDGFAFTSAEGATLLERPALEITFLVPEPAIGLAALVLPIANGLRRRRRT